MFVRSFLNQNLSLAPDRMERMLYLQVKITGTAQTDIGYTNCIANLYHRLPKSRRKTGRRQESKYQYTTQTPKHQAILPMSPSDKSKLCNAPSLIPTQARNTVYRVYAKKPSFPMYYYKSRLCMRSPFEIRAEN